MKTNNPPQSFDKQFAQERLQLLSLVIDEEYSYIDKDSLGYWCGLNRPWWKEASQYSLEDYLKLLRQLQTNEVPNIGLRVAKRTRIEDSGIIGYAMLTSPTLEQALQIAIQLIENNYPYLQIELQTTADHALLTCAIKPLGRDYFQILTEEWLISAWRYIQSLLPEGVAACASYAALNYKKPTYHWQYQQILGCRVDFQQTRSVLAIPKQWLFIQVQGSNTQAQSLFKDQIRRLLREDECSRDIISQVKRLLIKKAPECAYSLEKTAPLLSLSPRTLRRYITDAGSSFRQICTEVRMDLAQDYLLNTPLTAQEIAYQLGYSQPNNFYRAFKKVYGQPPDQFRKTHPQKSRTPILGSPAFEAHQ